MKHVLVTGGLGFIGSHTVVELHNAGYTPIILDNLSNSSRSVLDGIAKITGISPPFYEGDFQDETLLQTIISEYPIDGVIHFAAFKAVAESIEKPLDYYSNNVSGLVSLLRVLTKNDVPHFVFSSSCTVYGEPDNVPIAEDAPIKAATSPYGATKQMDETILQDTTAATQLKSIALRYFNPIGAHESALIGELPKGTPANLVPFITQAAAGLRDELTVNGDDYPTNDGTCVRDYIHVVDLAKAHIKALEYAAKQKPSSYDIFNLGTGTGSSVLEVITTFQQTTGVAVPHRIGPRRSGDTITSFANAEKAQKLLGWKAEKDLATALADAWRWQRAISSKS